ncbi:unnamed protein product [Trichogramma brassicae]|uniref:Uncharacterized protein n=1 Tax=Trichogramma brassicae TaxID=86971 RepID=A0A6H5IH29_9HYME|nr:unnamed protein product [Trichogramma brassicae]
MSLAICLSSILRMWQYGMLRKLTLKIKPPLLDCMGVLKYKQARLADVYGAFCILAAGALAALALFFCERAWASRQRLRGIQRRFGISRAQPLNKQPAPDKHEHRSRGNVLLAATSVSIANDSTYTTFTFYFDRRIFLDAAYRSRSLDSIGK